MKYKLRLALVGYLLARSWLPTSWGCLLSQLWLELEAWPNCNLESTGTGGLVAEAMWWVGCGGYVVGGAAGEMENKAISAQPTELELD